MTKEQRLKKNKHYIKILNEKNPTESKLEKQKRLAIIGKKLFDSYVSSINFNLNKKILSQCKLLEKFK